MENKYKKENEGPTRAKVTDSGTAIANKVLFDDDSHLKSMERDNIRKKNFKVEGKSALRPHNPLFRPLTPPIKDDESEPTR